jgi:hypothetical protein
MMKPLKQAFEHRQYWMNDKIALVQGSTPLEAMCLDDNRTS